MNKCLIGSDKLRAKKLPFDKRSAEVVCKCTCLFQQVPHSTEAHVEMIYKKPSRGR